MLNFSDCGPSDQQVVVIGLERGRSYSHRIFGSSRTSPFGSVGDTSVQVTIVRGLLWSNGNKFKQTSSHLVCTLLFAKLPLSAQCFY